MRSDSAALTVLLLIAAIVVLWALLTLSRHLFGGAVTRAARATGTSADDLVVELLRRTGLATAVFVVVWSAPSVVDVPPGWRGPLRTVGILALTAQLIVWTMGGVEFMTRRYLARTGTTARAVTAVSALSFATQLLLLTLLVLLALANLGVNVSTLLAGLGVGGIAVALALQSVLKDVLGAITIVVNRPFLVGDLIEVDGYLGEVLSVDMRSTRLLNLPGEEVSMPNQHMLDGVVRNHSRMRERRVSFVLTLHHATRTTSLADVEELVRGVVSRTEQVRFERAKLKHAHPGGFDVEIVYYVESPDYDVYTARHHVILLGILRDLEARGIALATPLFTSIVPTSPAPE